MESAGTPHRVLLHGWPDSAETWRDVAPALVAADFRVLAPFLRGYGPTRFLDEATFRSGQLAALGRDLIDFVDALRLQRPVMVGHDWGARAVANACGLRTNIASHRGFTRFMWDTWGPRDWITQERFDEAAAAFENPDWAAIVLHSYRHRWGFAEGDPDYAADEAALTPAPPFPLPMLVLHGREDYVNHPDTSAGKERFFTGRYERVLLDGVGHFPQREAPAEVAGEILRFCA